jgi:hypothetical protein
VIRLISGKANALNPRSLAAIERAFDEATSGDARGVVRRAFVDAWYTLAARRRIGEAHVRLAG